MFNLKNAKSYGKIYETTDYGMFKFMGDFNRKVMEKGEIADRAKAHIIQLRKSLKQKHLLRPALVDTKGNVYDGQHYIKACEAEKLPVRFMVSDNLDEKDVQLLNSVVKKWNNVDNINLNAYYGLDDYVKLVSFMKDYDFNVTTSVCILTQSSSTSTNAIKNGKFKIKDYEEAIKITDELLDVAQFFPNAFRRTQFVYAYIKLRNIDNFDFTTLMFKCETRANVLNQKANQKAYYLEALMEIYNHRMQTENKLKIYNHELNSF